MSVNDGMLGRLGLLPADADEQTADLIAQIKEDGIETVRFLFPDQHGVLRGKALVADAVMSACRNGVNVPSSLALKDTSHRTAFDVWNDDAGFGAGAMTGASDLLLIPHPTTYRRLPWSPHSAWVLCDIAQTTGTAIPFASRSVLRTAIDRLASRNMQIICGLEVEFHVFRIEDDRMRHADGGMPGAAPKTLPLNHGYQLLTDNHYGAAEDLLDDIRRTATAMGLSVRSAEVEFGPSQFEFTFDPAPAMEHADNMVIFRTMVKQLCQRKGLNATFMCRPAAAFATASGWHLHQSLVSTETGENLFMSANETLTPQAAGWISGLLAHAEESCLLTTPTVNGYKRYQPFQLAPDRIQWGRDNRGAMIRALLRPGDEASRVENRVAEPAANPHYFFASQILSGLSGIEQGLQPPPPVETPYQSDAKTIPTNLGDAIAAFEAGTFYRNTLGDEFVTYLSHLKRAEWNRYLATVSEWEDREYSTLF